MSLDMTEPRDESDQPELPATPAKRKFKGPDISMKCEPKRKRALMAAAKRRGLKLTTFLLLSAEYQMRPSRKGREQLAIKDGQLELPAVDPDERQLEMFPQPKTEGEQ